MINERLTNQIINALYMGNINHIYDIAEAHGLSREQAIFLVSLLYGYLKFLDETRGPEIS